MRDAGECRYPAFIFKVFQKLHSAMNSVEHSGKENLGYPTKLNCLLNYFSSFIFATRLLNLIYSTLAVTAEVTSANGVAQTTPFKPISILKIYIAGMSTTPFLMIDNIKDALRSPAA